MTDQPDLLLLRLETLESDTVRVRAAVELADERWRMLQDCIDRIQPHRKDLNAVATRLNALVTAMEDEPEIGRMLAGESTDLDQHLIASAGMVRRAVSAVKETVDMLVDAMAVTVRLDEPSRDLRTSLYRRCDELTADLTRLRVAVVATGSDRRQHWAQYHALLEDVARPLFAEYVDFLGGLTVRDIGLDDQVCEMTDALLTRFKGVTRRSLPLPAHQAALGNALDSVVLLGFPEWSVWGIPLVGHEVGLAYASDQNDSDLVRLVQRFSGTGGDDPLPTPPPGCSTPYVRQVVADAFATYTLGLAYACATLLLRLSPRHEDPRLPAGSVVAPLDGPTDVDRARILFRALEATGADAGGSLTDDVEVLRSIWESAVGSVGDGVTAAAPPGAADVGPAQAWLDELTDAALAHFRARHAVRPYDVERWKGSEAWVTALRTGDSGPGWAPADDAVVDVLTATWRLRLRSEMPPETLAKDIKARWPRRGAGTR